jgi:pimeloyl-ACP methyl ester carboxylesterase
MKKLKHFLRWGGILTVIFCIAYLLGPRPETPRFSTEATTLNIPLTALDNWIAQKEANHKVKPDNEARIVWANDSSKAMTAYSMVYLHGFSASQKEGNPVHLTLAKTFGCNLYLSRLSMHGLDTTEQLLGLTADNYWESAREALQIGKLLGKKVILMGTSTGGTLALLLAAAYPDDVAGLILMSPNIAINNPSAWLLNNPWGLQIARLVTGGQYIVAADTRPEYKRYWNTPYRIEALVELQEMLEHSMKKTTFERIKQPLLLLYYYKDAQHQDNVVRVDAMQKMFGEVSTPMVQKRELAIPNAGDHVIGSTLKSGDVATVIQASRDFLQQVMGLPTVPQ